MRLADLVIYAVDVGSVREQKFAWASSSRMSDGRIETLVDAIVDDLSASRAVALGFESPLWVPIPQDPNRLGCARTGEGARSWSAGAGCGALATGLVQSTWVLERIRRRAPTASAHLDWSSFDGATGPRLLFWEAFVSGAAKGKDHAHDAMIAVDAFVRALPSPAVSVALTTEHEIHSLIGAAMLRTGWASDAAVLREPCLVLAASAQANDDERKKRDDEFIGYLVRMGLSAWFRDHGRPRIAEIYEKMASEVEAPPSRKRKRR